MWICIHLNLYIHHMPIICNLTFRMKAVIKTSRHQKLFVNRFSPRYSVTHGRPADLLLTQRWGIIDCGMWIDLYYSQLSMYYQFWKGSSHWSSCFKWTVSFVFGDASKTASIFSVSLQVSLEDDKRLFAHDSLFSATLWSIYGCAGSSGCWR